MIPDLTPKHRQQAEELRDRLNALIEYGTWGAGYAMKEPDAINVILAAFAKQRRLERQRIAAAIRSAAKTEGRSTCFDAAWESGYADATDIACGIALTGAGPGTSRED